MLRSIKSGDAAWAWANNESTTNAVEECLGWLDTLFKAPFFLQYCSEDVSQVRKSYNDIDLINNLDSFSTQVGPESNKLGQEVKLMMAMHQSRAKVSGKTS